MQIHLEDENEPVQVDPESVELEDDDPYLSQDEVDNVVQKRLSRERSSIREQLKEDEDFFRKAAQERGYDLNDDGSIKGSTNDEELKELRKEKAQLEQKAQRAEELQEQIEAARQTDLENRVLKHATDVKDGAEEDVLRVAQDRMTYDEEEGRHVLTEDGDIAFTSQGKPAGADALISELRDQKPYLFKDTEVEGGSDVTPGGGSNKRTWTEEEWEEASTRTHQMSESEFQDWDSAQEEGRVQ